MQSENASGAGMSLSMDVGQKNNIAAIAAQDTTQQSADVVGSESKVGRAFASAVNAAQCSQIMEPAASSATAVRPARIQHAGTEAARDVLKSDNHHRHGNVLGAGRRLAEEKRNTAAHVAGKGIHGRPIDSNVSGVGIGLKRFQKGLYAAVYLARNCSALTMKGDLGKRLHAFNAAQPFFLEQIARDFAVEIAVSSGSARKPLKPLNKGAKKRQGMRLQMGAYAGSPHGSDAAIVATGSNLSWLDGVLSSATPWRIVNRARMERAKTAEYELSAGGLHTDAAHAQRKDFAGRNIEISLSGIGGSVRRKSNPFHEGKSSSATNGRATYVASTVRWLRSFHTHAPRQWTMSFQLPRVALTVERTVNAHASSAIVSSEICDRLDKHGKMGRGYEDLRQAEIPDRKPIAHKN